MLTVSRMLGALSHDSYVVIFDEATKQWLAYSKQVVGLVARSDSPSGALDALLTMKISATSVAGVRL